MHKKYTCIVRSTFFDLKFGIIWDFFWHVTNYLKVSFCVGPSTNKATYDNATQVNILKNKTATEANSKMIEWFFEFQIKLY